VKKEMVKSLGPSASGAVSLPCGWPIQTNLQHKKADSDGESTDAERLDSRHAYDQVIVIPGASSDGVPTLSHTLGDACLPALRGYC
jgi:hypothetical protein